jgi:hypothetical protein
MNFINSPKINSEDRGTLERKINAYKTLGEEIFQMVSDDQQIPLTQKDLECVSLAWSLAAWCDYNLDKKLITKEELMQLIVEDESPYKFFTENKNKLKELLGDEERFKKFFVLALKTIDASEVHTVESRHKEGIYFAQALMCMVDLNAEDKLVFSNILIKLASAGNFLDDVFDYRDDGTKMGRLIRIILVARKQFLKAYRTLGSPFSFTLDFYRRTKEIRRKYPLDRKK